MHFELSPGTDELLRRVRTFIAERIAPVEADVLRAARRGPDWTTWTESPGVEELKARAREEGLWNFFLELPVLEYAPLAEAMGHSALAPEIFNCNAPDTGNMEVLHHYGSEAQKQEWLTPLLRGEIRSVFCMTEPDVASSDA
ncbi:MAG TPA: acyl-CoA dehydrogenase family protein, partial [Thermoanaerobaculia bacterium]|nr:acyl-CoA dehydrogenase family protein [Thermoanaerobaculia bacterium]